MNIIPYRPEHRKACIALFIGNCPPYFDPAELNYFITWLNAIDKNKVAYSNARDNCFFVIENAAGAVVACGGYYTFKEQNSINMAWGMVDRKCHRMGYGKALTQFRINHALERDPQTGICLGTSQHTFQFYEKMGFVVQDIKPNGFGPGIDQYDMVLKAEAVS